MVFRNADCTLHCMDTEPSRPIRRERPLWLAFGLLLVGVGVFALVLLVMPLQSNPEERNVLPRQVSDTYVRSSGWAVMGSIAVVVAGLAIAGMARGRRARVDAAPR